MQKRILSIVRESFSPTRASVGDVFLLRWAMLCVGVLGAVVVLQACGFFAMLHDGQLILLAGHPFYMSAEDAQVSLLSPAGTFGACVVITLYMGAVLLLQRRMRQRSHLCLLAAVAVALPGLLCVLWHGVLYVAQPLFCVFLLWLVVVPAVLIRRFFS